MASFRPPTSPLARYGPVPVVVGLAVLLRLPLWPVLGGELPYLLLWPAVAACAVWGGLGPGLLATTLSAAAAAFLLDSADPVDQLGLAVFVSLSAAVGLIGEFLHQTLRQAVADRERWAVTVAGVADAVITTDPVGRVAYLNPAAERLTGWPASEAVGRPLGQVFRVVAEQTGRTAETPALGAAGPAEPPLILVARDGTRRSVERSAGPVRAGADAVLGAVVVFRDVTARRQAELAAQLTEAQIRDRAEELQALMDVLPVPLVIAQDPDGRQLTGNRAAHGLFRLPSGEPLTRTSLTSRRPGHFTVQVGGRPATEDDLPIRRAATTGRPVHGVELDLAFADGSAVTVLASAAPLFDLAGNVRGCVGVFVDLTDRKRAEEVLREADRRKDEFLATLGHELRNPLAAVRNAAHLLRADPSRSAWVAGLIGRQADHLARMVDDLLDVSRLAGGKVRLRVETVELAAILHRAVETARPLIQARNHDLTVNLPRGAVWLDADPVRLSQVFANLLTNAAKYTDPGGRIIVAADRDGAEVAVAVTDTGVGIPADVLPKVFELFTQADRSLDQSQGGLGLGLSLVKGLVEMHGGRVEAHSCGPGMGSTFTVRLPVAAAAPAGANGAAPAGRPARPRRVLVVDDNRDAADTLAMLLQVQGHEVTTAADGPSALAAAAAFRPEVVLLDIGLPGMDGYEVARRLRQLPEAAGAVLAALTGFGRDDDRQRAKEAGFDHHLTKPADPAAVEKLLGGP